MIRRIVLSVVLLSTLGCASQSRLNGHLHPLEELAQLSREPQSVKANEEQRVFRREALQKTAVVLGARRGLAWRARQIYDSLLARAGELDRIFDFSAIMLEGSILPPVVVAADQGVYQNSPQELQMQDRAYRIVSQARFVTTVPTWRDYFVDVDSLQNVELPHQSLWPARDEPREALWWREALEKGWQAGLAQAEEIFALNIARLHRDYKGMLLYKELLAHHMITAPSISRRDLGVTGNGESMNVNERHWVIDSLPTLLLDVEHWEPALVRD